MTAGSLSKTAHRVDHCPEANNLSAWKKASIRINCSEYSEHYSLKIIKKRLLYHCLPSTFLNETIEFCGPNTAIEKGMWGGGGSCAGTCLLADVCVCDIKLVLPINTIAKHFMICLDLMNAYSFLTMLEPLMYYQFCNFMGFFLVVIGNLNSQTFRE